MALHRLREHWSGTVMLVFQPGEEKEPGGASLLVKEGVFNDPRPTGILGQHVTPELASGKLGFRSGPFMAAADQFDITITGRQTHGSAPWRGVDPIVVGAQIVNALQTIVSRNVDITRLPAIVSVGQFQSGVRNNIIPDRARLVGTIRTFDEAMRADVHERVRRTAEKIAEEIKPQFEKQGWIED